MSLTLYLDSKVVLKKMWAIPELKSDLSVAITRRGPYLKLLIKAKSNNFALKSVRLLQPSSTTPVLDLPNIGREVLS